MNERAAYRVTARLILIEDGRVLLARHVHPDGRDFWCFPGGSVERGEGVAEAARREAREELGLEVELQGVAHVQELSARGPVLDVFFLVRRVGGKAALGADPEHEGGDPVLRDIAWVPVAEVPSWNVLPEDLAAAIADGSLGQRGPLPPP
jgi:8-oxo-dGTP diphosphatase